MTDSSNSTDRIVIEASHCGGEPVAAVFEGYGIERIAEMIEAVTGCSLLGPHDPRVWREHRARRVAEIKAALGIGRARKPRKPRLDRRAIARAEKATGKAVTSITLPDGTTLTFGETTPTDANPWDEVLINAADKNRPS